MRGVVGLIAGLLMLAPGFVRAENWNFDVPAPTSPPPAPAGVGVKSAELTRVFVKLNPGQQFGEYRYGLLCAGAEPMTWKGGAADESVETYRPAFFTELSRAGFKTTDPNDLFAKDAHGSSDLQVGVMITSVKASICEAKIRTGFRGKMMLEAEWQVYSRVKGEIVARIPTRGAFASPTYSSDAFSIMLDGAFAENVRQLIASEGFRKAALDPSATNIVAGGLDTPIALVGAGQSGRRSIADATGSVVAVFAGQSLGSGFLVSNDGYVITNHHVVGESKYVKIRWSDGFETVGEVIRSHKRRDIALIKTDPRGRQPLALRRNAPPAGDTVFAIGTPLDPTMQNTVTKGIVSASRILDGFNFIQSDVVINGGNSGGPLLDESGAVVGVCVSGIDLNGAPAGLNFFIPIGDALDFLALRPQS